MPIAYVIHMQRRCEANSSIVQVEDWVVVQEECVPENPKRGCLCLPLGHNLEEALEVLPSHIAWGGDSIVLAVSKLDLEVWEVSMGVCQAAASKETWATFIDIATSPRLYDFPKFLKIICRHQDVRGARVYYGKVSIQIKGVVSELSIRDRNGPVSIFFKGIPAYGRAWLGMFSYIIVSEYNARFFISATKVEGKHFLSNQLIVVEPINEELRAGILVRWCQA